MEQGSGAARWAGIFRIEGKGQRGDAQLSPGITIPDQFLAFVFLNPSIIANRSIIKEVLFMLKLGC